MTLQVTGPTSFAGLEGMLGDNTKASKAGANVHTSMDGARKSSLLGRLAGTGKSRSAVEGLSSQDLQRALTTSMGAKAVAQANNAMKRR